MDLLFIKKAFKVIRGPGVSGVMIRDAKACRTVAVSEESLPVGSQYEVHWIVVVSWVSVAWMEDDLWPLPPFLMPLTRSVPSHEHEAGHKIMCSDTLKGQKHIVAMTFPPIFASGPKKRSCNMNIAVPSQNLVVNMGVRVAQKDGIRTPVTPGQSPDSYRRF